MEDFRRGGNGRRTEGRSDYGAQGSERKSSGERKFGSRPRISRSAERTYSPVDRPRKPYGERSYRSDSEQRRTSSDRPRRPYGDRPYSDRPYSDKPRTERSHSDRPHTDRPYSDRPYSSRGNSDRPRRSFGDRPYGEDRPRRQFSDRPAKPFSGRGQSRPGKTGKFRKKEDFSFFRDEDQSGIGRMIERRPVVESSNFSDNDMISIPVKEEVRLNKFIANSGICSRREADNFILAGVVTVNGEVVTELGTKINITTDDVRFNGERVKGEAKVYIVMNKPKGYVTTSSDPHAEKTVMDLLKGCPSRVFPVGRLDKNTTGVLMFTNDGEIAEKLTHPSYDKKKIYQVSLDNKLKGEDYDKILSGVELTDGVIAADALEYIEDDDHRKIGIEIHSGKNRIVRRIFESLGYEVKALDRVYFAGLTKKGIKRGGWRYLTEGEINLLKMGAYL